MLSSKLQCHVIRLLVWSAVFGPVIVAAGKSTEPAMHTTENAGIEACKRFHHENAIGKDPIWCIGKLSKTMLVITQGRMVFEMPLDALNRTIDKFYLGNYAPVPMEKKWPALVHDGHYQRVKTLLYGCIPVRAPDTDYLMLLTWIETDNQRFKGGVTLDLKTKSIVPGNSWYWEESDKNVHWISSDGLDGYYRLYNVPNSGVAIRLIHFCHQKADGYPHNDIRDEFPGTPCHKFKECNMMMPNCEKYDKDVYPLCKNGDDGVYVIPKKDAKCEQITWDVWDGFVDSGKFYLFGKDYVFIFSEEAYKNPDTKVTVRRVPFGDFIQCGGNPQARDMEMTKKSPVAFGLIVAIILIIVLCCLCILLCLMREAMARRKKKRKGKKGSRVRSSGLPGFGALTAMVPGASKRSRGVTSAKPLSKKGNSASKRSVAGPSAARPLSRKAGASKRSAGASGPDGSLSRNVPVTKRSKGGPSAAVPLTNKRGGGRSGGNDATGRSGNMRGASSRKGSRKNRGPSGTSNRATQRSKLRK